jgi:hypothetical protein
MEQSLWRRSNMGKRELPSFSPSRHRVAIVIRLGFLIFRRVQITIDLGGFETHRSGFKSKEMNPATLAPWILWLSAELLLDW